MTEPDLVRKIKKALIAEGAYAAKIHGGRFSVGVPDLLVCHDGRFFAFEVKLPGKEGNLTELQRNNLLSIRKAGGIAWVITSIEAAIEIVTVCPLGREDDLVYVCST